MKNKKLPPEIVSLIHHVELNKSGWWKKSVAQIVQGILWINQDSLTLQDLHIALEKELGIRLADDVLAQQLKSLSSQGAVIQVHGKSFKLTEKARTMLSTAHNEATKEQEVCHQQFVDACSKHCPDLDSAKVWSEFSQALTNAVQVTGANLFHLLSDGNLARDVDWLSGFLSKFERQDQKGLRATLMSFFAPQNQACRNQVLRLLSAHFFAEATQLRPETLALIDGGKKIRSIKVVLDTNFIFSILGLHDNPGDDAALSLIEVAKQAGHSLDIKFYVLPSTLDEAKRVLLSQLHLIERIRTTTAMAQAALTQPLPSIAKKFFDAAACTPNLSASSFFQPYIDGLRFILQDKGIPVLEMNPEIYNKRQDVIDDVLDERQRQEAEVPERRWKSYDALLHDAVLWHAVLDRRSADSDSPFEIEYWAVTIDWRLIVFDRKKRGANTSRLPVVLHPSNLLQLVQFWVPRSKELEKNLVDSLRLPLYFQSFDPDDERATIKVLEVLSRYENVDDLPEQTVKKVLADQALRAKLRDADASNDEAIALIREELFAEHRETVNKLQSVSDSLKVTKASLAEEHQSRTISEEQLAAATRSLEDARSEAIALKEQAEKSAREKAAIEEQLKSHQLSQLRQRYTWLFIALPIVLGVLIAYISYRYLILWLPTLNSSWMSWIFLLGTGVFPLAIACIVSPCYVARHMALYDWWLCKLIRLIGKKGIIAPISMTLSALFQGGVWDWFKTITSW